MGSCSFNDNRISDRHLDSCAAKTFKHPQELLGQYEQHPINEQHPIRMAKFGLKLISATKSETGTVESALVLIPTVLLFLSVLQIAASVLGRGIAVNTIQGEVSREALLGSSNLSPSTDSMGTDFGRITLPGGGAIIIGSKKIAITKLTPLIISQDKFLANGIAIDEN